MPLSKPERFTICSNRVFFNYHIKYITWNNKYDKKDWHGYDEKFIGVGIDKDHWFNIEKTLVRWS